MPQPTRTITLDVSALSAVDLKNLAHVAGRAAGSTAIGTSASPRSASSHATPPGSPGR